MWVIGLLLAAIATGATLWWLPHDPGRGTGVRLNRAAGKLAALTVVLLGCAWLAGGGPPVLVTGLTAVLAAVAVAAVLGWGSAAWLLRPRLPLWLLGLGWVAVALFGSWVVGYALALRGNPARFIDGRLDASPFGYGAWFGILLVVAGLAHLRWVRETRDRAG